MYAYLKFEGPKEENNNREWQSFNVKADSLEEAVKACTLEVPVGWKLVRAELSERGNG